MSKHTVDSKTMNRNIIVAVLGITLILLGAYALTQNQTGESPVNTPGTESQDQENSEEEIRDLVTSFGETLQNVSVFSPNAAEEIEENYSEFVGGELLESWKIVPEDAPGRQTSSPHPERIEVEAVIFANNDEYRVSGDIIETTESEEDSQTFERPIEIIVQRINDKWLITEFLYTEEAQ